MSVQLILALSSVCAVFAMAGLTYIDGMLFPSQMVLRYPVGFPFIANGGMWGDLLFVTLVLYIIGNYTNEWSWKEIVPALILGVAASYAMHYFVYLKGDLPDSLAGGGRPISPAGWVHVAYFGVGLALIGLFYFCSTPTINDVIWVGTLLALHIIVANHVPFYYIAKANHFSWCTTIFDTEAAPLRILVTAMTMLTGATLLKLFGAKVWAFLVALL